MSKLRINWVLGGYNGAKGWCHRCSEYRNIKQGLYKSLVCLYCDVTLAICNKKLIGSSWKGVMETYIEGPTIVDFILRLKLV